MSDFRTEPDLTDLAQLYAELVDHENALLQQAAASGSRSGASGHPHPEYFFGRVARAIAAAAAKIKPMIPSPPNDPPADGEVVVDGATVVAPTPVTVAVSKPEPKNKK